MKDSEIVNRDLEIKARLRAAQQGSVQITNAVGGRLRLIEARLDRIEQKLKLEALPVKRKCSPLASALQQACMPKASVRLQPRDPVLPDPRFLTEE